MFVCCLLFGTSRDSRFAERISGCFNLLSWFPLVFAQGEFLKYAEATGKTTEAGSTGRPSAKKLSCLRDYSQVLFDSLKCFLSLLSQFFCQRELLEYFKTMGGSPVKH